ncbi:UxaA family hydrolase [Mesorhizobium sp. BR1-1-2]|uniref:UxaA family hydrolase n=1 Tax=Mesorhizobium sp. BR1-1-2 TaxID=2876652 RepID=UPI001CCED359|nr:UxaA family hydrolase [Mesorhizobium sp. BR1-1-2]MBZ9966483.1 UxaA family hydrolase [Mesorhizobium sp. BR1-1-2]
MDDPRLLLLCNQDNVLVACRRIEAGETIIVGGEPHILVKAVELGHKLARLPIASGVKVVKYGVPIGSATQSMGPGEHVHIHNLKSDYTKTHVIAETGS